jgi:hypothetical protein
MSLMRSRSGKRAATTLALSVMLALPASLAAQFTPRVPPSQRQRPDFLFGHPHVVASLRVGYAMPTEGPGEIVNVGGRFPSDQALDFYRHNLNSASVEGELAVRATERLYITGDVGYAGGKTRSEYVNYVDNNNLPIQQTTRLSRTDLTFGVKEYLWAPGRSIGRLAWVPRQWAPFVGAAGGWMWYTFRQSGDFVDFQDLSVYSDRYGTSAKTGTFNVFGGADLTLSPFFSLTVEGRYTWAHAPMQGDFSGFKDINLSGFRASGGISLRF